MKMQFQVGDKVVHWAHGPGKITQLDEKELSGHLTLFYVVEIKDLTIWVPVGDSEKHSLRLLTPPKEFEKYFEILSSPAEELPQDRLERKSLLSECMRAGTLESLCRVVRDLVSYGRIKKLNDNDEATLARAQSFLLHEWTLSLSITLTQAEQAMEQLLGSGLLKQD